MHAFLQVRAAWRSGPAPAHRLRMRGQGSTTCSRRTPPRAQVQNKLQLEAVTNLISVGDSHIEMDAVHLLGRSFAHALVKTV